MQNNKKSTLVQFSPWKTDRMCMSRTTITIPITITIPVTITATTITDHYNYSQNCETITKTTTVHRMSPRRARYPK